MMNEFDYAWKYLIDGGVLLIDNAYCTNAVADFSASVGRPVMYFESDSNFEKTLKRKMRFAILIK